MTEVRTLSEIEEIKHPNMDCVVVIGGIRRYFTAAGLVELADEINRGIHSLQAQGCFDEEYNQ